MTWHSTAEILLAFLVAGLVIWLSPLLLELLGLGEFVFVGQAGLTILALSLQEAALRRLPGNHE